MERAIKPGKSVGDLWVLCREPQAFAVMMERVYKISTGTYRVTNGREYVHLHAKVLPKKLIEKILSDTKFVAENGIIQVHFEQPTKAFGPTTGL